VRESSPPRPLTWKRSVDASSVNCLRFVRWNLMRPAFGSRLNTSPSVGAPLTSVPSLPASPFRVSEPSPLFHTSVSFPAPPLSTSAPTAPMMRSLPSPPLSVSLLSAPVRRSSPGPPSSPTAATSSARASTKSKSLPAPPLTITVKVPSAGTVCAPSVALSQSVSPSRLPVD
jgi:hypothetical protein